MKTLLFLLVFALCATISFSQIVSPVSNQRIDSLINTGWERLESPVIWISPDQVISFPSDFIVFFLKTKEGINHWGFSVVSDFNVEVYVTFGICGAPAKIDFLATGGHPPYVYFIDGKPAQQSNVVAPNAEYDLDCFDSGGNSFFLNDLKVMGSEGVTISFKNKSPETCKGRNGGVTIEAQGVAPFAYSWPDWSTKQTRNDLAAGKYKVTVTSYNQCQSSAEVEIVKADSSYKHSFKREACDSFRATSSLLLTRDTMLTIVYKAVNGCDSSVALDLDISQSSKFVITKTTRIPTEAKSDTVRLTNSVRCDSLVITITALLMSDTTRRDSFVCQSWMVGMDTVRLLNQIGGDSIIITRKVLVKPAIGYSEKYFCNPLQKESIDTILIPRPGTLCDSILYVRNLYRKVLTTTVEVMNCEPMPTTYDTLMSNLGCDSVIATVTKVFPQKNTYLTVTSCLKTGIDTQKLFNQYGCDSLVVRTYVPRVIPPVFRKENTCDPLQAGISTKTHKASDGCDSVVTTEKVLIPSYDTLIQVFTCDPLKVGIKKMDLKTKLGCDSIVTVKTDILAHPNTVEKVFKTDCEVGGTDVDTTVLKTIDGCESVVITTTRHNGTRDSILAMRTECTDRNVDTTIVTMKTNPSGCEYKVTQRVVMYESVVLRSNGYDHPDQKWNGRASFIAEGGTLPYTWRWSNTNSTKAEATGLKGGMYDVTVTDAKGCKDTATVKLSDFWGSTSGTNQVSFHGGLADQQLIDSYGAEDGIFTLYDINRNVLHTEMVYMPDEFKLNIPVSTPGMLFGFIELPNGYLLSIIEKH